MMWQALRRVASTPALQKSLCTNSRSLTTEASGSSYFGVNYRKQLATLDILKRRSRRPLTLTEKLLYSHLIIDSDRQWDLEQIERGNTILELRPDRIACHDATATMALLQFISAGLRRKVRWRISRELLRSMLKSMTFSAVRPGNMVLASGRQVPALFTL